VLFVCMRSKSEEVPPPLPCGVTPKDMLLANIHMKCPPPPLPLPHPLLTCMQLTEGSVVDTGRRLHLWLTFDGC